MSLPSVIFFGTPQFAVASLQRLFENNVTIKAVVTAPDKAAGRGQKISISPVKEFALQKNLPVLQPANLKSEEFINILKEIGADLFIVVAFRMLPRQVWEMPPLGTFNLHASLLPQYRGAAPINWAIINGETRTGITTFFLQQEIDTGKIIAQESFPIKEDDTAETLHDTLMVAGSELVLKTVEAIARGKVRAKEQEESETGKLKSAPKLNKENTKIIFSASPTQIRNLVRGLSPYPGAHCQISNSSGITFSLKIFSVDAVNAPHSKRSGKITSDNKSFLYVFVPGGYVSILELQLSGRKKVSVKDFLNGIRLEGDWWME